MLRSFMAFLLVLTPGFLASQGQAQTSPAPKLKILVIHGPNMNLLGRREPQIYGTMTLDQINEKLDTLAKELNVDLIKLQTNHEGVIVDTFQAHVDDVDGAILADMTRVKSPLSISAVGRNWAVVRGVTLL